MPDTEITITDENENFIISLFLNVDAGYAACDLKSAIALFKKELLYQQRHKMTLISGEEIITGNLNEFDESALKNLKLKFVTPQCRSSKHARDVDKCFAGRIRKIFAEKYDDPPAAWSMEEVYAYFALLEETKALVKRPEEGLGSLLYASEKFVSAQPPLFAAPTREETFPEAESAASPRHSLTG